MRPRLWRAGFEIGPRQRRYLQSNDRRRPSGLPLTFDRETLKGCSDHLPITAKIEVM